MHLHSPRFYFHQHTHTLPSLDVFSIRRGGWVGGRDGGGGGGGGGGWGEEEEEEKEEKEEERERQRERGTNDTISRL